MNVQAKLTPESSVDLDHELNILASAKDTWARTSVQDRVQIIAEIKEATAQVAEEWATTAARKKLIPEGSPLEGEEWISGPYAVISACNGMMETLSKVDGKAFLDPLPKRRLPSGQLALSVMPHSLWDHLLLSGITAEVWMQDSVTEGNLAQNAATAYDVPITERKGKVALILGAGNIASIPPLDTFQKVFIENQVVLLKMNPVNDYLTPFFERVLKPLIDRNALRIIKGDGAVGAAACEHPLVEELHITGAGSTHDLIVWGAGEEAAKNKAAGTPKNPRHMTSELGAVCPTIVLPGQWSKADLRYQAEQIATQKMHNSGFNCIACQTLIMPKGWDQADALLAELKAVFAEHSQRMPYYPGAGDRIDAFADKSKGGSAVKRGAAPDMPIADFDSSDSAWMARNEIFAPAMNVKWIDGSDVDAFLTAAVDFANDELFGTLGANIVIHPRTLSEMGKEAFERHLDRLHYGAIAVNTWTGANFLLTVLPWGGFPNSTLDNVGSGIGTVHNTFMLENVERTVVYAPWRPFPRGVLSGQFTLLPKPPWFITNKRADKLGKQLVSFQHKPGWLKIPGIFINALLG